MRIGIDVDNVIVNFNDLFIREFNRLSEDKLDEIQLTKWDFKERVSEIYNTNKYDELIDKILTSKEFFLNLEFLGNAKKVLEDLYYDEDIDPIIITAAPLDMKIYRDTWFNNNFENLDFEIHYETDKKKIKVDYMIDDGLHNLDELSKVIGVENCLCIKSSYNYNDKYKTFDSLEDAISYIRLKEKI